MGATAQWLGSIGVGLLLPAFLLNLSGRLGGAALPYRLLSLAGASMACRASWLIDFVPFAILEGAWAAAALAALARPGWNAR